MSSSRSLSDQQASEQHGNPDNHLNAPGEPTRPTPAADDWEYYKRGPKRLASIGNTSWVRRAERERLAKQRNGEDTTYVHRWWLKEQHSAKASAISRDAEALAKTWGRPIGRSADEPEAEPIFAPTEIRFHATEYACDDFRFRPDRSESTQTAYGHCNTDMMPYDQLVAATMLVMKYHLGDDVAIKSDGDHRSSTWSAAVNLYLRTFPDREVPNLDNWPGAQGHVK